MKKTASNDDDNSCECAKTTTTHTVIPQYYPQQHCHHHCCCHHHVCVPNVYQPHVWNGPYYLPNITSTNTVNATPVKYTITYG